MSNRRRLRARRPAEPGLEILEGRLVLSTLTVTSVDDSGPGTLRQAILDADAGPGGDTIAFDVPGPGVHTIRPATGLPAVTVPVTIDGYTQPGSNPNDKAVGDDAVLDIEIRGDDGHSLMSGLDLAGGDVVRGLTVDHFGTGTAGSTGTFYADTAINLRGPGATPSRATSSGPTRPARPARSTPSGSPSTRRTRRSAGRARPIAT